MTRSRWTLASSLLVALLVVAGCGGSSKKSGSKQTSSGSKTAVTIRESEYRLNPANPKVAGAKAVVFQVHNAGTVTHALEVKGPKGQARAQGIQPGSSATLKVDLSKAGSYQFF